MSVGLDLWDGVSGGMVGASRGWSLSLYERRGWFVCSSRGVRLCMEVGYTWICVWV